MVPGYARFGLNAVLLSIPDKQTVIVSSLSFLFFFVLYFSPPKNLATPLNWWPNHRLPLMFVRSIYAVDGRT